MRLGRPVGAAASETAPAPASDASPVSREHPVVPTTSQTAAIVGVHPVLRRSIPGTGFAVHPVALSGKPFGTSVNAETARIILDVFAALGGNMIDTADSYADGRSEEIIGEWIGRRAGRDDVVIATKVGKSRENPGLSAPAITAAVEASLRRLRTDRIDLLYLHIDDESVPFEETLLAVDGLIRSGKVRAFGMSDHTGNRIVAARIACAILGVAPMTAVQNEYSLMHREFERDLARVAAQQGLAVIPRFPLAGGFLTGDYRTRADLVGNPAAEYVSEYLGRRGRRVLSVVDRVAESIGASQAAVSLAWLLSKPGVVAPVVAVTSPEQLIDVMSAPGVRFSRHHLADLDRSGE